jgi:hypothetical protein
MLKLSLISIQFLQVMPFGIVNQGQQWHNRVQTKRLESSTSLGVIIINPTRQTSTRLCADYHRQGDTVDDRGGSYQSSAPVTKGIVSSLTSLTNSILATTTSAPAATESNIISRAPTSPQELLTRIQNDYTENNYLWTGNLDTSSFISNCTFTDPTLSFVGVEKYIENVKNLVPVVRYLLGDEESSRSDLMNITLNDEEKYVETRWNMIGELNNLFWKPKIDVIGRTKFWYQEISQEKDDVIESAFQVYFYDEMWEIPAGLALLQLVTKAETIPNTGAKK